VPGGVAAGAMDEHPYTSDLEHGVAGERQPVAAGRRRTTLCPGVWPPVRWTSTPGATWYSFSNGRTWLWYSFKNRLPVRRSASGNPGGNGDAGEVGRLPELGLGGRQVDPQVRTQPVPHPVDEQPATVVHAQVGKHHVESRADRTAGGERADAGGRTPS